jgi:hypothetical protein
MLVTVDLSAVFHLSFIGEAAKYARVLAQRYLPQDESAAIRTPERRVVEEEEGGQEPVQPMGALDGWPDEAGKSLSAARRE